MENLKKIDHQLNQIERRLNIYSLFNPINKYEEKEKFFSFLGKRRVYNPKYKYKILPKEHNELKSLLYSFKNDGGLESLFRDKIKFMLNQLKLAQADDSNFGHFSSQLYGRPNDKTILQARDILTQDQKFNLSEEKVSPVEMAKVLKAELKFYKIDWKIVETSNLIPKISISADRRKIFINANYKYRKEEVHRLKIHEMVHVLRGVNGEMQPWNIFKSGIGNYEETEEGLAVYSEEKKGKLKLDPSQLRIYAGRALAVEIGLRSSFYETFCELKKHFPLDLAYRLTERVKRGMSDTSKRGAFTKEYYYLSGWNRISHYIENGGNLKILYTGKIGLKHVEVIESLIQDGLLNFPRVSLRENH